PGRVASGAAGDSAARMCARPAQIEAADVGKPVARLAEEGPPGEHLVEGVLAVHRVPATEAVRTLEIRRRNDVARDDALRDSRCVGLERPDGRVCYLIP